VRALVTGGAGFIGSTLTDRLLAEGHSVDVADDLSTGTLSNLADARTNQDHDFSFHRIDVRSPELVDLIARRRPEVIFHLAAQADVRVSVERPAFDAEVNILGTLHVLEGARAAETTKVVFAASGGTLYGEPTELPVAESAPQRPLSPYGVSKKAAIDYLAAYRELYDLEFSALALANVYGPRQDPHGEAGVVAIFANALLAGKPTKLFGDGGNTRDYVYVEDVVAAFVAASGENGGGQRYNIGTGQQTSDKELHSLVALAAGAADEPEYAPARLGDLRASALDASKATRELGWVPEVDVKTGAARTVEYFRTA
jgi:UDP-glucose 4-epimerase